MDLDNSVSYFTKLFDDVLNDDEEATFIFKDIIINNNLSTIKTISENIKYEKSNEIIKKACKICLDLLLEISKDIALVHPHNENTKKNRKLHWVFLPITVIFLVGFRIVRSRKN
jgi:hypothetical protein